MIGCLARLRRARVPHVAVRGNSQGHAGVLSISSTCCHPKRSNNNNNNNNKRSASDHHHHNTRHLRRSDHQWRLHRHGHGVSVSTRGWLFVLFCMAGKKNTSQYFDFHHFSVRDQVYQVDFNPDETPASGAEQTATTATYTV